MMVSIAQEEEDDQTENDAVCNKYLDLFQGVEEEEDTQDQLVCQPFHPVV